jgi:catechol 2,3-dioxygenase-like lactoylglutathione lyase family enzyme
MTAVIRRAHLILYVRDQARSTRFYAAALDRAPSLDLPGMTEFALLEGTVLGLMPEAGIERLLDGRIRAARHGDNSRAELYLLVADARECYARAVQAGATEVDPPALRDWGDVAGYLLDPDGHVLAFATAP